MKIRKSKDTIWQITILPLLLLYVSIFSLLSKMTAMNFESK